MNELAEKHMWLARSEADKFFRRNPRTMDQEDLLQEAYFALVKATEGYNSEAGVKFTTYASRSIQFRLKRVHEKSKSIASGGCDLSLGGLLKKIIFDSKGEIPTAQEIIDKYKVPMLSAKTIIRKYRSQSTLYLDMRFEGSELTFMDCLDIGGYKQPDLLYEQKDLEDYLVVLLNLLPLAWREIIDSRYFKNMSLQQLADAHGITARGMLVRIDLIIKAIRNEIGE